MRPSPYNRPKRPVDPINRFLNWTMAALLLASSVLLAFELMSLMRDDPTDQPQGPAPITTISPTVTCSPIDPESTARQPGYAAEDVHRYMVERAQGRKPRKPSLKRWSK